MPTPPKVLSVTELTRAIKNQLESHFTSLTVRGEVTNLRKQISGHTYFSLKDANAQISAVLFKGNAKFSTYFPKIGDQVIVKGEIGVYAPRGTYQIIVREINLAGLGELLLQFHQLKEKLGKRGWFDAAHKKRLPLFPQTIGVVTSPTGAVIQDILNVLKRRFPNFHLILSPVKVQGSGAAEEIARAIDDFNRFDLADVLIVGRGGGSLEDLWAFNEECVAEAIFRSNVPIISAIGHEIDVTIADYIADMRAPTPSAAAELSLRELNAQLSFLDSAKKSALSLLSQNVKQHRLKLSGIKRSPIFSTPYALLSDYHQQIDGIYGELKKHMRDRLSQNHLHLYAFKKQLQGLSPENRLKMSREKLHLYKRTLNSHLSSQLRRKKEQVNSGELLVQLRSQLQKKVSSHREKLSHLSAHLQSINPKNLLKKGYCIPFAEKDHSVIMSSHAVRVGETIHLHLHDGTWKSTIEEVSPEHG